VVAILAVLFLDGAPGIIYNTATADAPGDAGDAAHWAHVLTGAAGNIGATGVARIASETEQHALAGSLDRAVTCREDLESALAAARAELTALLTEHT
jgi:HPt (histidine-containing phosphotransfer) domain-containing protein